MTKSAGPALRRLHERLGDRVRFVSLYVREAHPGARYPQPDTIERKLQHARDYAARDGVRWTVAVDDVEGSLHRQLDPKPHAAYLVGSDGTVWWRSLWANDHRGLEAAVEAAAAGGRPENGEVEPHLVPMLAGTGEMWDVWEAAGGYAASDVLRQAPPMYVSGRIADVFRPLPTLVRGMLGMTLSMAPMLVGAYLLGRRRRHH